MAQRSTFTCDNCEEVIKTETHTQVVLKSPGMEGGVKTVDLCVDCDEQFMDGTLSGSDLFLQD